MRAGRGAIRFLRSKKLLPLSSLRKAAEIAEGMQTSRAGMLLIYEVDLWDEILLLERWTEVFGPIQRGQFERLWREVLIGDEGEQVANDVEAGAPLVLGIDDVPGCLLDVGYGEHFVFGPGVFRPSSAGFQVHRAELPAFCSVLHAVLKAALLLFVAD